MENKIPKVSIIMPAYNASKYIRESLDSALSQTMYDIEIVCMNDGSSDDTEQILFEYAAKDSRVRPFSQTNAGCARSKNNLLPRTRGEFVTFLDSDDFYLDSSALEKLYNAAKRNNALICGGFRRSLGLDGTIYDQPLHRDLFRGEKEGKWFNYRDLQYDYHHHSYLYDRKLLMENNIHFLPIGTYDDQNFTINVMLKAERFFVYPVELYCYRDSPPYRWSKKVTNDGMRGVINSLKLSRDNRLALLHWITIMRVNHNPEYYDNFIKYLNEGNVELLELTLEANKLIDSELIEEIQKNPPVDYILNAMCVYWTWKLMQPIMSETSPKYILMPLRHILGPDLTALPASAVGREKTEPENNGEFAGVPSVESEAYRMTRLERDLREELDGVRASASYRVGRTMTWLPRIIRGGKRCLKNHGLKYTIVRFSYEVKKKFHEKPNNELAVTVKPVSYVSQTSDGDVKVTIVVPVFNVAQYLRECLDSILAQTLKNIEIICGDGGSNDGSLEILQEYASKDSRLTYITKEGSGYGQSVNECMDMARGKYIGIVESDDVVLPEAYERLYDLVEAHQLDWVRSDFYYYYAMKPEKERLKQESIIYGGDFYNVVLDPQIDYRPFKSGIRTWSGIYNREYLNRYQIRHNETPGGSYQDAGFYMKNFYYARRTLFSDKPFYMWRQDNPGSSMHYNSKKLVEKCFHEFHLDKADLEARKELGARAIASYHFRQFYSYLWMVDMADESDKYDIFKAVVKEFREADARHAYDKGFFDGWEWERFQKILNDPDKYFTKHYGEIPDGAETLPAYFGSETNSMYVPRKKFYKRPLRPLAELLRKIAYKGMRDVLSQMERKIDDSNLWNRGMVEAAIAWHRNKIEESEAMYMERLERLIVDQLAEKMACVEDTIRHFEDSLNGLSDSLQNRMGKTWNEMLSYIEETRNDLISNQKWVRDDLKSGIDWSRENVKEDMDWWFKEIENKLKSVEDGLRYQEDKIKIEFKKLFFNLNFEIKKDRLLSSGDMLPDSTYDDDFIYDNRYGSVVSGTKVLKCLLPSLGSKSIVDFGCSTGAWLYTARRLGVNRILGIDGDYVNRSQLMIREDEFMPYNLENALTLDRKFDLAISMEVAEHLREESADTFVSSLCSASDVILFSAAHPGQGGDNHINEQPMEYWQEKFSVRSFRYIEIRPIFKEDWKIEWWYRDNMALFVKEECYEKVKSKIEKLFSVEK